MISLMEQEALAVPQILTEQFAINQAPLAALSLHIMRVRPKVAMTIARGSSDHAATFAKYLLEVCAGILTASAAPSVYTLYHKKLPLKNALVLGISQSGASPDIIEMMKAAREEGAITVAFVNEEKSVLAEVAEYVIKLSAGKEQAVAATKTYLATLGALIQFIALLTQDASLLQAMTLLPEALKEATQQDWSAAVTEYQNAHNTLVIGRGFSFPVAQEAALKFKETAHIHAEAFSGAELLHGPFALIEKDFPILMFAQPDKSLPGMLELAARIQRLGARVLLAAPFVSSPAQTTGLIQLPMPASIHPICDPLLIIQACYLMMARLSTARGFNPDEPLHLTKVTQTW